LGWGRARKDRRMEDGGTAAVLYERIVRGVGRLHTPALSKRLEWLPWRLRTRKA
jgi:hypothetical protein